jgi:hypothetical protein
MFGQLGGATYTSKHLLAHKGLILLVNPQIYKKRQRADGRNYTIQVPRPKVIEDYQKNMGYIDRHNRFRQNILGLAKVWRTKKWQVRVLLEIFGMAVVDSFASRHLVKISRTEMIG